MRPLLFALLNILRAGFFSRSSLALENAALRQQLAIYQRSQKRPSSDHPEWGEDKIAEELAAKFGIEHSTSTIRRYMVPRRNAPRGDQTWRAFIRNHGKAVGS